jgi:hypothetical protein
MRDLGELNLNVGGKPCNRAVPSPDAFSEFERATNVTLPREYKELLSYSNGAHPELDTFDLSDGSEAGVARFFFLSESERENPENLWRAMRDYGRTIGRGAVPIATDGCGNIIYLNYASDQVEVWFWSHDPVKAIRIASSFEKFIDSLRINPDYV